jgi:ABC-type antimicrobial peptide transport system permease subunit
MGSAEMQLPDRERGSIQVATTAVGPDYFKTLGVTLVEGREFDGRDGAPAPRRAIVNESAARQFWPRGGATGSLARIGGIPAEIVGVVADVQYRNVLAPPQPVAYFNYWQQDTSAAWSHDSRTHVRVAGEAGRMLPAILRAIASVDPDVPISEAKPLADRLDDEFSALRTARAMFLTFGVVTLVVSAVGLYAALAFAVGQRRREIAIRMALGADRLDVGALVLRRGALVVSIGIAVGSAIALTTGSFLAHMLYGVSPRDPLTLLAGPSVLAAVALVAIFLPARRAMRVDPIAALRVE